MKTRREEDKEVHRILAFIHGMRELGISPAVTVLVALCVGILWYGARGFESYIDQSRSYNHDMIQLVTGIQHTLIEQEQSLRDYVTKNDGWKGDIMKTVNNNSIDIAKLQSRYGSMEAAEKGGMRSAE